MRSYILILTLFLPLTAHSGENILVPMLGYSEWSDNSGHIARGGSINFKDDNDITFGFKYLYQFDSGFALGGNIYVYDKDVLTTSQATDAGVSHIHFLAEYFFNPQGSMSPFIGGGFGFTGIGFNNGLLDDEASVGESIELNAGLLFRLSERVGFQLEYKFVDFDIDEDIDGFLTNIESESHSLMFGVSIHL